jgi:hypothetical protein
MAFVVIAANAHAHQLRDLYGINEWFQNWPLFF